MNEVAEQERNPPPPDLLLQEGGADAAAVLLRRYVPETATWDLAKDSQFWDAVRSAHALGRLGDGKTIAVIDVGFDVALPALAPHATADAIVPGAPTAHGTVAALLALEVAPHARLRMYAASEGGALSPERVIAAIERAVIEGADIINLSMGVGKPDDELRAKDGPRANPAYERGGLLDPDDWRMMYDVPGTPLWAAARAAVEAGVTVVASAGNYARYTFVPAAVPGVVSVGFHTVLREVDPVTGVDEASSAAPNYSQSLGADVLLVQPAHVLGSSFACPLISGFAAVMRDRRELPAYLRCVRTAANGSDLLKLSEPGEDAADFITLIDAQFKAAFGTAPHAHYERPEDGPCPECSLFANPMFIDFGIFTAQTGNPQVASVLTATARRIAPWNPHAAGTFGIVSAGLAKQAQAAGDHEGADVYLTRAIDSMSDAVRLRPGFAPFEAALAQYRSIRTSQEQKTPMAAAAISIRIDDDEDLAAAREAAERQGVALEEVTGPPSGGLDSQVDPVTAVLIGAGVVAGIKLLMDWWGRRKGGLVIDLRPDAKDLFYRDDALDYEYVVTLPADGGKVTVEVKDNPDAATTWINKVIEGGFKSFTDLATEAKKAVGADKVETVEP